MRALAQFGDPAGLRPLIAAAAGEQADLAEVAMGALAAFPGGEAEAAVLSMLGSEAASQRRVAVEVIAKRGMASAAGLLVNAARDGDEATRLAAIRALGDVAPVNEISAVVRVLGESKTGTEAEAAERAVAAVIARAAPRETMAEPLIGAMGEAGAARRGALLRLLSAAGGPKALETVRSSAKGLDKQVQDAAIRALCDWPTADAAPDVLALAKGSENPVHRRLALRGYVRMIADKSLSAEQRGAMCREAVSLAQSAEEKKPVLAALAGVPTRESLDAVMALMDDAAVSEEAVVAAMGLAEKMGDAEREAVTAALTKAASITKNEETAKRVKEMIGRVRKAGP
jgi:hypothetical protein